MYGYNYHGSTTHMISAILNTIQAWILPAIVEEIGELGEKEQEFIRTVEMADLPSFMAPYAYCGIGCPPHSRLSMVKAFIAKAVWNMPTTRALIDQLRNRPVMRRLCGWETVTEIPDETIFSRAFRRFSQDKLAERIHQKLVEKAFTGKVIGHGCTDATAIEAREKPATKPKQELAQAKSPCKRGRRRKGEEPPAKEPRRLELQPFRTLDENLADLPTRCDVGCKKNSKGYKITWNGFKLHINTAECGVPLAAILTSASVHDSQVGIPLIQKTSPRVQYFYDLMDAAYDAPEIWDYSQRHGHVPIIDFNKRRGEEKEMEHASRLRFAERSAAERANSTLKDNYGGRFVRVRGVANVMCHLMFGILAITGAQLARLFGTG
jgi:hypothetical protein